MDWDEDEVTNIVHVAVQQPVSHASAFFIVLAGTGIGEMYRIQGDRTVIGRSTKADISILDDGMSRAHCEVTVSPSGEVLLRDRGSTNGTFVNGDRVDTHPLKDGDKVQLGGTTILKFTLNDRLEETFQRHLYEAALRDSLTKAFNKKYFHERLAAEFAYAARHGTYLTLLMLDLDHFKNVNDTYGHLAGDYVLEKLSKLTMSTIRTEDVFARYGGEEFVLIARGIRPRQGAVVGERIRSSVERARFVYDDRQLSVTISVGVAGVPAEEIKTPDDLVAAADQALYAAKNAGRNQVAVFQG